MNATIRQPLERLRRREQMLGLAWGVARVLVVVAVGLTLACLVDWWIDRRRETPLWIRFGLLGAQALAAAAAAYIFIGPILRRRGDDDLSLFVESRRPELNHRLVSAVQLNRRGADVHGMSNELIAGVTQQAAHAIQRIDFAALADHRRLKWAGWMAFAIICFAGLCFVIAPSTVAALLARQFMFGQAVPRTCQIIDKTDPVQPAAEPVTLRFGVTATGPLLGELRIKPDDGTAERLPLAAEPVDGILTATIPPPPGDFAFEAWVGDGRLKTPGRVKLVPRPAITQLAGSLILPDFVGLKPNGMPYEATITRGEIAGIAGSSAWVFARTQKPVVKSELEIFGFPSANAAPAVLRTLAPIKSSDDTLAFRFELRENESAYRLHVWDEHGFQNLDPPRRDVRLVPEEPPVVQLLPELFRPEGLSGPAEDFEVEGIPIPLGGAIRIAYVANHPYGLGKTAMVYRVNEGDWQRLSLTEIPATPPSEGGGVGAGPFDPKRGCFANSRPADQVQFHAVPSPDPEIQPGRLDGGGRFDFHTRGLPDLKAGDQIEYFIEVSSRNPNRNVVGRSETRQKRVVTTIELVEWIDAALQQEDRIRRLSDRQRGVFDARPRQ